ncbi:hypothetical protein D1818_09935 [Aquimarina sp. BL5]|uniref:hypothetical protein n=1 Tax=Aquimarina sp. BL5 TaxID=1714860 RepID=UPI000E4C9FF2|nr:hypothetical protein [Aquimarina sp. BL5]AXT51129.1 hypothetical protein D1818_09935 [Aquimarina sp. BL5]RKM90921.1 hypothetical protein D7036_23785 [Aquimarina sp. BL5]
MILLSHKTLLEDIQNVKKQGFTVDFLFKDDMIYDRKTNKGYGKRDCVLIEYCRHEGLSDPSDASILFLIACFDGVKGCLSSNYGVHADLDLMQFALSLRSQDHENKSHV